MLHYNTNTVVKGRVVQRPGRRKTKFVEVLAESLMMMIIIIITIIF